MFLSSSCFSGFFFVFRVCLCSLCLCFCDFITVGLGTRSTGSKSRAVMAAFIFWLRGLHRARVPVKTDELRTSLETPPHTHIKHEGIIQRNGTPRKQALRVEEIYKQTFPAFHFFLDKSVLHPCPEKSLYIVYLVPSESKAPSQRVF